MTRRQQGIALLEALIAFLVLAVGLLMIARLQIHLRLGADLSRQRSEAVRLAQKESEELRSFAVVATSPIAASFEGIVSQTRTIDPAAGDPTNTSYRIVRQIGSSTAPKVKTQTITASWNDRSGVARQVVLNSMIAGIDPAYTGFLGLVHANNGPTGAVARASGIPVFAKDLGNGSSAFKPVSDGTMAFVFNNASGALTSVCTGIASQRVTGDLSVADLGTCDTHVGFLLSGVVRYSFTSPPDIGGRDFPLSTTIGLSLTGSGYLAAPVCTAEAAKTVWYVANGSQHVDSVPALSTAASFGLSGWLDTGDRYAAYYCAVYPSSSGFWSGRSTVVPSGWTIGTGAADHRVCRYSSDLDHNGKIDAIEHPDTYASVGVSLSQQNFIVIMGRDTCPGAGVATAQHQP
jgi:Tfp pilus assembly protein PilV